MQTILILLLDVACRVPWASLEMSELGCSKALLRLAVTRQDTQIGASLDWFKHGRRVLGIVIDLLVCRRPLSNVMTAWATVARALPSAVMGPVFPLAPSWTCRC